MLRSCVIKPLRTRSPHSIFCRAKSSYEWEIIGESASDTSNIHESTLHSAYKRDTQAFGQLVHNYHHDLNKEENPKIRVVPREQYLQDETNLGDFRDEHGEANLTAREARLQPNTIEGRVNRNQVKIPERITKSIYNHMLALKLPKLLKYEVAQRYVKINQEQVHGPTNSIHEIDSHIAAFFAQNYASTHQVLSELFKRQPDFSPQKVLDISYGPATGMIALNEIKGKDFKPKIKDAVILGHEEMQNRAKLLLSRQLNEYPGNLEDLISEAPVDGKSKLEQDILFDDFVGEVKTNKIRTRTKVSGYLNTEKKYDLIIAQHQLLQDLDRFPYQVDENVDVLLKALEPNGILVLVERGTPVGFESIARARQVMIRPERYEYEKGKIPRPYYKASSVKHNKRMSQNVEFEDYEIEEIEIHDESKDLTAIEKELIEKFGEVSQEELKFDHELEVNNLGEQRVDYHVSVIAPCSHHKKCPLQTLKPQYYRFPTGRKLNWCHFEKMIERPRYLLELKRGNVLSSKWESEDSISPKRGHTGSGREFSNNYEIANYSYLIVERSANDNSTLDKIESERAENSFDDSIGKLHTESKHWPRILRQPLKRKGHVTFETCASSGEIEKWIVTKSFNKETYYDARKAHSGDLWGLDAKTRILGRSNQHEQLREKLENYEKELISKEKKRRKLKDREGRRVLNQRTNEILTSGEDTHENMVDLYTATFNNTKKQRQRDRRGGLQTYAH